MKLSQKTDYLQGSFVRLKGENWLARQRVAGKCLADIMSSLQDLVRNKTTRTALEIAQFVDDEITSHGCTATFKNYKGFPSALCLSVNKQLVHGIPSDSPLQEGDIVSFDFGVTFEGAIADSAVTLIYGQPKDLAHQRLVDTSRQCLYNAIKSIAVGRRLGAIGNAIYKTASQAGFNVITKYGGHGIDWDKPHADIFVANKSTVDESVVCQPGLTIAIEPLLVPGNCSTNTYLSKDGWTVCTEDVSSHHEHSLFVHPDHVEVLTWRPDEENSLPRNVYFN